jgi:hypothetical protein
MSKTCEIERKHILTQRKSLQLLQREAGFLLSQAALGDLFIRNVAAS